MFDFHDSVSAGTHLGMAAWSAFAAAVLLRLTRLHPLGHRLSVLFYALSAVTLYTASGLFHGLAHPSPDVRRVWQLLDQTAIFGLILGSNVPLYEYLLAPRWRNRLLAMMTAVALAGAGCLWVYPWVAGAKPPHEGVIAAYLLMGVLGLVPIRTYFRRLGWGGMLWVLLLIAFYVGGAAIEAAKWPVLADGAFTYHEILHIADMFGTAAHLVLLVRYVLPTADAHHPRRRPAGGFQLTELPVRTKL